ncbi:MAG: methylcobamide--CoM methyltransferase [Armatimonadota bacterium]|nr:methylcobamide--CoM methyltransferase [Armatimonadota bacterium]MDR5696450.1 methylcobamide--CoM methyltransferase [Armatimonadota bacterium]
MITTVVGSYPKVPDLPAPGKWRTGAEKLQRGQITPEAFRAIEDEVTREVIAEQVEAGLDLITDGQIRWEDGQTYFARRMGGFSIDGLQRWFDTNVYYREPVCEGEVTWREPITVEDYRFAVSSSPRPVKPVVTGPYTIARLSQNRHYPTFAEFVLALARTLNRELHALAAERPSWIQVDEPAITQYKPDFPLFRDAMAVLVEGVDAPLALYTYFGDVAGIYPQILDLPFGLIGLDFVAGHRNWEVVQDARFPDDRVLGFGILDARNTRMETVDEVRAALDRVAKIVPLDRLHLSPSAGLEFLPRRVARAKIARIAEVKRVVEGVTA